MQYFLIYSFHYEQRDYLTSWKRVLFNGVVLGNRSRAWFLRQWNRLPSNRKRRGRSLPAPFRCSAPAVANCSLRFRRRNGDCFVIFCASASRAVLLRFQLKRLGRIGVGQNSHAEIGFVVNRIRRLLFTEKKSLMFVKFKTTIHCFNSWRHATFFSFSAYFIPDPCFVFQRKL